MNEQDPRKELMDQFPKMFQGGIGYPEIGNGWLQIVKSLCQRIQYHIDWNNERRELLLKDNPYNHPIPEQVLQVKVMQIKEKFGGLRFYYDGGDDMIDGMVRMAESWAAFSCEVCGNRGQSRKTGWIKTLCDEHHTQREAERKVN